MLQGELTEDQLSLLMTKLDEVSMLFLERTMAEERKKLYIRTMVTYPGYRFTYDTLLQTFDLACHRFTKMPSAKEIIETKHPDPS